MPGLMYGMFSVRIQSCPKAFPYRSTKLSTFRCQSVRYNFELDKAASWIHRCTRLDQQNSRLEFFALRNDIGIDVSFTTHMTRLLLERKNDACRRRLCMLRDQNASRSNYTSCTSQEQSVRPS
jgi:hypothetical protein